VNTLNVVKSLGVFFIEIHLWNSLYCYVVRPVWSKHFYVQMLNFVWFSCILLGSCSTYWQ